MANKMDRFTSDARQILSLSQKFAEDLGHSLIEPEHMLLAMTKLENIEVHEILADTDIVLEKLLPFVKSQMSKAQVPIMLDLSASTKKLLELSVDTARRRGHHIIHSTHFLVALMRLEHHGVEAILAHFQVESKDIIKAVEHDWVEYPEKFRRNENLGDLVTEIGCWGVLQMVFGVRKPKDDE
jgi:ATP-dependent Clp protease ATP-binding subunit ClpA